MYTRTAIVIFLLGCSFTESRSHNRVKRGYYSEGEDGPELVEELRAGEEVHFTSNAPPPENYGRPDPGFVKFTWVFKAVDDCQLVAYLKEYEPGDRNCEYQIIQLGDEEEESNVCGYAPLDGDFRSGGKILFVKHIIRAGTLPAYFSCHVKCIPSADAGEYEDAPCNYYEDDQYNEEYGPGPDPAA